MEKKGGDPVAVKIPEWKRKQLQQQQEKQKSDIKAYHAKIAAASSVQGQKIPPLEITWFERDDMKPEDGASFNTQEYLSAEQLEQVIQDKTGSRPKSFRYTSRYSLIFR